MALVQLHELGPTSVGDSDRFGNDKKPLYLATAMALSLAAPTYASPVDPATPAPALRYPSAFADYKPWQDAQPGDWRALNDAVRPPSASAHGHGAVPAIAHPSSPPQAKQAAPVPPGHSGHGDHSMHGGHQ